VNVASLIENSSYIDAPLSNTLAQMSSYDLNGKVALVTGGAAARR
jgi:hypothetical protein